MAAHAWWRIDVTSNDGSNFYTGFTECEMHTAVGGANACSGGAPSASNSFSSFGRTPDKALDLDTSTFWCTDNTVNSGWWAYHFASAVDIVEFCVSFTNAAAPYLPSTVGLSYSDDGLSWTVSAPPKRLAGAYYPPDSTKIAFRASGGNVSSYWRVNVTASDSTNPAIAAIELRASVGGADQCGSAIRADARNYNSPSYPSNVIDGNTTTYWVGQISTTLPLAIVIRFPDDVSVAEYVVRKYNGAGFSPTAWTLDYSGDGLTWTTVDTQAGVTAWAANEAKTFAIGGGAVPKDKFFLLMAA